MLSIPCNSWIFYTRIRVAYHNSPVTKYSFFALWSVTLIALGVPATIELTSTPLGNGICLFFKYIYHRQLSIISILVLAVFDTAVMAAISVRMVSCSSLDSWRSKLYCLVFGNGIGHISRLFLTSSQIHHLWVPYSPTTIYKELSHHKYHQFKFHRSSILLRSTPITIIGQPDPYGYHIPSYISQYHNLPYISNDETRIRARNNPDICYLHCSLAPDLSAGVL